jgi:hypothetical protein
MGEDYGARGIYLVNPSIVNMSISLEENGK